MKNTFIRQTGCNSAKINIDLLCSYEIFGEEATNTGKCIITFEMVSGSTINWIYKDRNDYGFREDIFKLRILLDHSGKY